MPPLISAARRLGPTWAALLSRTVSDEPLRATAASGPDQARWPVEPPQIDADAVPDLFARIAEQGVTGSTVAAVWGDALSPQTAAALQDASGRGSRPRPVVVDGRRSGVVFVAVDGDVPHEAVTALVEHAAAATRSLLQIDLLREHGDRDDESGVLSSAALDRTVAREMIRARRYDRPLTLVVVRPGEPGSKALRALGETLEVLIRETDFVARLDETHLSVLLPETDQEGGQTFVVRVLGRVPGVYASAANYPADGMTWEALVSAALAAEELLTPAPATGRRRPRNARSRSRSPWSRRRSRTSRPGSRSPWSRRPRIDRSSSRRPRKRRTETTRRCRHAARRTSPRAPATASPSTPARRPACATSSPTSPPARPSSPRPRRDVTESSL
jgi:hypothetical protein